MGVVHRKSGLAYGVGLREFGVWDLAAWVGDLIVLGIGKMLDVCNKMNVLRNCLGTISPIKNYIYETSPACGSVVGLEVNEQCPYPATITR